MFTKRSSRAPFCLYTIEYMEMIFVLVAIVQSVAVSLGVGSSTLAITNFFVAIADGKIDENERKMMGIVYVILRIAMMLILLTTASIAAINLSQIGTSYITPFVAGTWTLTFVLFANAILMTKHIMPSNVGPALQASTWYSFGVLMALVSLNLDGFSYFEFIVGYAAAIALAIAIVNGTMAYLKEKRQV